MVKCTYNWENEDSLFQSVYLDLIIRRKALMIDDNSLYNFNEMQFAMLTMLEKNYKHLSLIFSMPLQMNNHMFA